MRALRRLLSRQPAALALALVLSAVGLLIAADASPEGQRNAVQVQHQPGGGRTDPAEAASGGVAAAPKPRARGCPQRRRRQAGTRG